jgi:hypothetical protein
VGGGRGDGCKGARAYDTALGSPISEPSAVDCTLRCSRVEVVEVGWGQ